MTRLRRAMTSSGDYDAGEMDLVLADDCSTYYNDPLGWVMWAFDWGHGELKGFDGPDDWQCDLLNDLGEQIKDRKFDGFTPTDSIQFATSSGHGIGKAQPYSLTLDTPSGRKYWGDIHVGDYLFGKNGSPTRVIARHEQGQRDVYQVTFNDGSATLVDKEHLWSVKGRRHRRNNLEWESVTTGYLLTTGAKRSNGKALARQWEIPSYEAVNYPEVNLAVDPYILGVWLGDGSKSGGAVTSNDPEIFDSIRDAGYLLGVNRHTGPGTTKTHVALGLIHHLRDAGVFGCTTENCCVPEKHLLTSVEQRRSILQGLLDTDGWVEKSGTIAFGSISKQLNDDVIWLARSLGLMARDNGVKQKWYRDKHNIKVPGKPFYTMTMTWDGIQTLFRLQRKQLLLKNPQRRYKTRWIDSIEFSHVEESMCVTVDAKDSLYLTNDFIVTHNSALTSWLILFLMSTRPNSRGVVTANTGDQLRTKTWAELTKWHGLCIVGHWFEVNSMSIHHHANSKNWRVDAQTCREENSEAFAGLHAADSTPFYIFDEAGGIPPKIWEVASGGLTDGESMWFAFGNPTDRNNEFYNCFHNQKHRWITRSIDSRDAKMPNKSYLQKQIDDFGEDSDRVRVRVRGLFPRGGNIQFIPSDIVQESRKRGPGRYLGDDPLICGIDLARGGDDDCMIQFRRGKDAKSEKVYRIAGENSRDSMKVVAKLTMLLDRHKPDVAFLDVGSMGGPIGDRLRELGYHVIDVGFGWVATDEKLYADKATEMWYRVKEWLFNGGAIIDNNDLDEELTNREYGYDNKDRTKLESKKDMKKRIGKSPDWADALCLTFAYHVPKRELPRGQLDAALATRGQNNNDYDPLSCMDNNL